jgi:hypothetical protein
MPPAAVSKAPTLKKTRIGSSKKPIFKVIPSPIQLSPNEFAGFMRFEQRETFPQLQTRLEVLAQTHPTFNFKIASNLELPGNLKKFTAKNSVPEYVCSGPNGQKISTVYYYRDKDHCIENTDTHPWKQGWAVLVIATRI